MHFEPNTIYHIYNQGNNGQQVFFEHKNYLFFIRKMRTYLLPYGDLLCYCLMPNHFHWLMYVRDPEIAITIPSGTTRIRTLNESIGILLCSYTRAINRQENRSGSLFREATKAKDGWENPYLPPHHPAYQKLLRNWELYGSTCFHYIHENPRPRLVKKAENWPYSSSRDYAGLRNGTLCNRALAKELLFLL
jgi:putative transposase